MCIACSGDNCGIVPPLTPVTTPRTDRHHTVVRVGPTEIAVGGEVDVAATPAIEAALGDPQVRIVDLSAVTFIDPCGLRAVLGTSQPRLVALTWRRPSRPVLRLVELTGHRTTQRIVWC